MNIQGSMFTDTGFGPGCTKGTLVAYDETRGIYVPAAAKWSTNYRTDGSVIPETSSYVLGVLITDVINTSGTVLTNGWIKDEELIRLMTGGLSGDFYLDSDGVAKAGRTNITTLPVYCFSYRKSADSSDPGILVFRPQPPEYAGHSHGRYVLPTDWLETSTGAELKLNDSLAVFDALQKGNVEYMSLVKNGSEVDPSFWSIKLSDEHTYTLSLTFAQVAGDVFILHTITPFTAEEPIVRSVDIARGCNVLQADRNSGKVNLSLNEGSITSGVYAGSGVLALTNDHIYTGPVVQSVRPGPGIVIGAYEDSEGSEVSGVYVISTEELTKQESDMFLCNLDGAVLGSSSHATSYVFPAGLVSKIHGNIRAPYIPKVISPLTGELVNRSVRGKLNIVVRGSNASIQSLNLSINRTKMPTAGLDGTTMADNVEEYPLQGEYGVDVTQLYLLYADVVVSSCDCLAVTLKASAPSAALEVVSVSLSLSE